MDALALAAVREPDIIVSQVAPAPDAAGLDQDCLETRLGERLDLDRYDIDIDVNRAARSLKTRFLEKARPPLVIVAYRSAEFLSAAAFCDEDLLAAFNFHLFQRQFEHKPYVEKALRSPKVDLAVLPTRYVRDTDLDAVKTEADKGKRVGRTSTGSGGAGVFLFGSKGEFVERLPAHRDGFVSIAPFLEHAAPLNVNGCVFHDGVAVFGVSYQLIGVEGLTARRFGFCGNDFAAARMLDRSTLDEIESMTTRVGEWLHRQGYLGVFGLDILVHEGGCLISELNPRFQASTPLSSLINQALEIPDPATEHLAAFLGLDKPDIRSCAEQTYAVNDLIGQRPLAQVIHRNLLLDPVRIDAPPTPRADLGDAVECVAEPRVAVANEAMMFRSMHSRQITEDGYAVSSDVLALNESAERGF